VEEDTDDLRLAKRKRRINANCTIGNLRTLIFMVVAWYLDVSLCASLETIVLQENMMAALALMPVFYDQPEEEGNGVKLREGGTTKSLA
jgi:hypothetical protein